MAELRRRYRGERYRRTRSEEIVKKAIRVFAKKGYENTSMDDIADRAKVAKGTLYYYFPSKEDLYQQVMVQTLRNIFAGLADDVKDETCPFRAFTMVLRGMHRMFTSRPDLLNLFLPLMNGQELPGQRRVEDLIAEILVVHRELMDRHFVILLKGRSPARAQVIRFLARSVITSFLIQLRKGPTAELDAFLDEVGMVLRDGLGDVVDCPDDDDDEALAPALEMG